MDLEVKVHRFIHLVVILLLTPVYAQEEEAKEAEKPREKVAVEELETETQHSIQVEGRRIDYTARAGTIVMRTEAGDPKASIFYVSYTMEGIEDHSKRAITFSFNGGPGSSSVWLHLGAFGPKRVLMDSEGKALPPPYLLVENEQTLLDLTDLVFIDPVTTGFSRPAPGEDPKQFHGVTEDVESVGEFIRLYVTRNKRWSSPKFLAGESYGTTRAAGLSGYLQDRHGMFMNGIVLISSVLDFQTLIFDPGNDLPYLLYLPSYAATAWYHGKLPNDLQKDLRKTLAEVERYSLNEYALALLKGTDLEVDRKQLAQRLSRYTGLSAEYVERSDFRIQLHRFVKELLRDEDRTVGRLDSRFKGMDRDSAGENFEYDPSYPAIQGPYTSTIYDYLTRELGFESDIPYEILTDRVAPWKFGPAQNRYLNVAEDLRQAMTKNPHLKVFVASGYYDLATPYLATRYTFNHMGLPPELSGNITMADYEAGHMMYIREACLVELKADLSRFFDRAVPDQRQ
jgi:carboxypeptidase C (cathepsin A)